MAALQSRASLELYALQSQMDPHFIFNSLNTVQSYILSASTERAAAYLTRFSRLMQQTIEHSSKEWISLQEELDTLELYLQLEQLQLEGQFDYYIRIQPTVSNTQLLMPPFIIQPYVQNAIWHRLLQRAQGVKGRLLIEVGMKDDGLFIRLEDNGAPRQSIFHQYQQKTAGTRVAEERLHLLNTRYHTHATVTTGHLYDEHHAKTGTYTIIHLPGVTAASLPDAELSL